MQVDKEKEILLPVDAVYEIIRVVVAAYVTKLRELPTKIAKLVNPHDIELAEEVLTEETERIIASIKNDMEKQLRQESEQEEDETEETEDESGDDLQET